MTRISRRMWFSKWVFPILWFGFLVLFVADTLRSGAARQDPVFLVVPIAMAVFGVVLFRKQVWDLADEVYDCGDSLLVRRGGVEVSIPLSCIVNVSASLRANPPRVTLRLVEGSGTGDEIVFSPAGGSRFNPFARNPLVDELISRVDQARTKRLQTAH